ncbi:MAG TPA: hypothetical protein DDW31_07390 [candidate division Zixibacteria bacterium]|nr:hypothetical protein [candidate division Zixibacteria bacterium]
MTAESPRFRHSSQAQMFRPARSPAGSGEGQKTSEVSPSSSDSKPSGREPLAETRLRSCWRRARPADWIWVTKMNRSG